MLYHILREARLDKALSSLRELHYISKATTSMLRMAYKNKQRRDLEETLRFTDDDETYKHRTYMDRLDVTVCSISIIFQLFLNSQAVFSVYLTMQ